MTEISVFVGASGQRHFRFAPGAATLAPRITECESAKHPNQLDTLAGRSAEFCPAHFTGQTLRKQDSQQNRNSGQRASNRSCTRTSLRGASWTDTNASCRAVENPKDNGNCNPPSRDASSEYPISSPRKVSFQPIRPGLNAEPSGYVLRFCLAERAQRRLTAKGIGVRGSMRRLSDTVETTIKYAPSRQLRRAQPQGD